MRSFPNQDKLKEGIERILSSDVEVDPAYLRKCINWWYQKSQIFPELGDSSIRILSQDVSGEMIQDLNLEQSLAETSTMFSSLELPTVSSLSFEDFKAWYKEFFSSEIRNISVDENLKEQVRLINSVFEEAFPNDPTIFPLTEESVGVDCRTTRSGGLINYINAELPNGNEIKVVAKLLPEKLRHLFERERDLHGYFVRSGYRSVTKPLITPGTNVPLLTYRHLAGDLTCLLNQKENIKEKYIKEALNVLMGISLDFQKHMLLKRTFRPEGVKEICDLISDNDHVGRLAKRFDENYILRIAAAEDGLITDDPATNKFYQILIGNFNLSSLTETDKKNFPTLSRMVSSPLTQKLREGYNALALRILRLPSYPGHDDFTGNNVLYKSVEKDDKGVIREMLGLKLHDVGLAYAPFQSFIYDILGSLEASEKTKSNVLRWAYNELRERSEDSGMTFSSSYHNFVQGYNLICAEKSLKQAAFRHVRYLISDKNERR